jgi:hypothetical protein
VSDKDDPSEQSSRRYRVPPKEFRFRKGVSGNPKGRPRKSPVLVGGYVGGQPKLGPEDRVKTLAIEEAYRVITVREGDKVQKVPVIQAILRKVAVAAANGNVRAQQTYLKLIAGAEADRRAATMELFKEAIAYKERWHHILAERSRTGRVGPEPVPHPDEIVIDSETWEVRIEGPVLQEQKDAQDLLHAGWMEYEQNLMETEKLLANDPNNQELLELKESLTEIVSWIRKDAERRNIRKIIREGLRDISKSGSHGKL